MGVVREFAYSDVLMLWDVLFTRHLARHFHLYLVVAVLQRHGGRIMADKVGWGGWAGGGLVQRNVGADLESRWQTIRSGFGFGFGIGFGFGCVERCSLNLLLFDIFWCLGSDGRWTLRTFCGTSAI